MEKLIKKVKLFTNANDKSKEITAKVSSELEKYDFEVVETNYDLAIAIGGDGSFLRMVRKNDFNSDIYYIGINAGTLGFLQEVKVEEIKLFVEKLNQNAFKVDSIGIQETEIITKKGITKFCSLNEIVIRDKDLNTTILTIKIDDSKLEQFVGDGILVATSIGSTAYNLSFGGSIVYNTLHTLQITPIAPLNSKAYRDLLNSVIVPENKIISIIPDENKKNLIITIDGENVIYENVEIIKTVVNEKRIKCLRLHNYSFSEKINEKFLQN